MENSTVEFSYEGETTIIQCKQSDTMESITNKFISKFNLDSRFIFYSYGGETFFGDKKETFQKTANNNDK